MKATIVEVGAFALQRGSHLSVCRCVDSGLKQCGDQLQQCLQNGPVCHCRGQYDNCVINLQCPQSLVRATAPTSARPAGPYSPSCSLACLVSTRACRLMRL